MLRSCEDRADIRAHMPRASLNICMIGAGYVGLVSAACLSEFGWKVLIKLGHSG
jgi:monoamine oxidase